MAASNQQRPRLQLRLGFWFGGSLNPAVQLGLARVERSCHSQHMSHRSVRGILGGHNKRLVATTQRHAPLGSRVTHAAVAPQPRRWAESKEENR
jgi:hypothetical protein